MRILSQDGMIDVPYEQICANIDYRNKCNIVAEGMHCSDIGNEITIAKYSSESKARKAMQMLREAYAGLPIIMQNVDISKDVAEMFEKWKKQGICIQTSDNQPSKVEYINNRYFQFPADEDVEVDE